MARRKKKVQNSQNLQLHPSRKCIPWSSLGATASIVVAVLAIVYSHLQLQLAQRSEDRVSGKLVAKAEVVDYFPKPYEFPKRLLVEGVQSEICPYYDDVNSLVILAPTFVLNNVGEFPIDCVRIETSFQGGIIDTRADKIDIRNYRAPSDWYSRDTPIVLKKVDRQEHQLAFQWKPGTSLRISALKGYLGQMKQAQSKTKTNRMHYALMEVNLSVRASGSAVFEKAETMIHKIGWYPEGFPDTEVNRVLSNYEPKIELGEMVEQPFVMAYPFKLPKKRPRLTLPGKP